MGKRHSESKRKSCHARQVVPRGNGSTRNPGGGGKEKATGQGTGRSSFPRKGPGAIPAVEWETVIAPSLTSVSQALCQALHVVYVSTWCTSQGTP